MIDLALRHRVKVGLQLPEKDPLSYWHFGVGRLKEAFALAAAADDPIDELHLRACNKGTKTQTCAAYVLACLQKRKHLDGVPLPQWDGPVEGAQLVLDYPQQIGSVQPAFLKLLGRWPHHARYKGEILSSLRVAPVGGGDESAWSTIHFHSQENRRTGTGLRGDVIAFDEPPNMEILRELRKAAHAGRRSLLLIGETPTVRSQWAPLRADYGDTPRSTLRRVDLERAEARWSLHEVADWILSPAEKAKLRRKYATDPLADAREHGDYFDASGLCPFDIETLRQMLEECREPEVVEWKVTREQDTEDGVTKVVTTAPVEVYAHARPGKSYYVPCDPSAGIKDRERFHDPGGLLVLEVGTGDLMARFNGYLGSYGLGVLQAGLCRQYNDAVADFETNGGWYESVKRGLADAHYGNIAQERRPLDPNGEFQTRLGWNTTAKTRPFIIGAIQSWLEAWRSGIKYGRCPSRAILECLLDIVLDEDGKPVAAPGLHDEDMILWGQGLRRCIAQGAGRPVPLPPRRVMGPEEELIRAIRGEEEQPVAAHDRRPSRIPTRPRA